MHIGVVAGGFEPESGGGFTFENEILSALADLVKESPHRFTLLAPEQHFAAFDEHLGASEIAVAPVRRRTSRIVATALREIEAFRIHWRRPSDLDRAAQEAGVDLIWFLTAQPQRTDLPYVTVVWDLQHRASPWFPEFGAHGVWDRRDAEHRHFLQRATKVVTGTTVGVDQLTSFFQIPKENTLLLPHPTPVFASHVAIEISSEEDIRRKFGLGSAYVLYPAQFWPHKNHVNIVLAISILRQAGVDVHLALPGSDKGTLPHVLSVAHGAGVSDLVHALGFVDRRDLIALYRHAVALTYVSWCGPENLPPLEAFALGCPVIATEIAGSREQLGDAALFCDPGSPQSIADVLMALLNDQEKRQRLIELGRARSLRFTPSDYVRGVFAFFDEFETVRRCWA